MEKSRFTKLVHYEHVPQEIIYSNSTPIFQTATFAWQSLADPGSHEYSRGANPTRSILSSQLAQLEYAKHALAFNSGVAAIATILELMQMHEHIIVSEDLYGGTYRLLAHYEASKGIKVSFVDTTSLSRIKDAFTTNTKYIFIETPSNPLHKISDIRQIAAIAHEYNALLIVDNTFLSPWLQNPLLLGADIVIHSATKFLSGHSDITAGCIMTSHEPIYDRLSYIQNALGNALSPFDSWLLLRSLKTLGLRVERQQSTALLIARFLADMPQIKNVYYAGLANHAGYEINKSQASGPGSVICFTTGSVKHSEDIINKIKFFVLAVSFGGVTSSIGLPFKMSHSSIPADKNHCPPDLIRLSVGIEDSDDLINDLTQAIT